MTLRVELRSTAAMPKVTPRRDVLLVVGYQSPTRFYYVHISSAGDAVHNGIFLVDNADRRRIDERSRWPRWSTSSGIGRGFVATSRPDGSRSSSTTGARRS